MRSRRSRGNYSAGVAKSMGTPTVNPPEPQGQDDYSGFKVPLSRLKKDWQGLYTVSPDIRSPQDYVRGVKDVQALPFARPEPPNQFIAQPLEWEDGTIMFLESGGVILSEGINPIETL